MECFYGFLTVNCVVLYQSIIYVCGSAAKHIRANEMQLAKCNAFRIKLYCRIPVHVSTVVPLQALISIASNVAHVLTVLVLDWCGNLASFHKITRHTTA